jgi:hypothetical protein
MEKIAVNAAIIHDEAVDLRHALALKHNTTYE